MSTPTPDLEFKSDTPEVTTLVNSAAPSISALPIASDNVPPRDLRFWLVILALCVSTLLSALDLTSVSTALPTIINDIHGKEYVWVGSAYALSSTAFLPLSGGLAQIFGRRPVMLASLAFFAIGSAICGSAQSLEMLIAGRTVQGIGGGGILSLTEIIVADLVPLRERGSFMGIIGSVWAVSSAIGPPIGGALANGGHWRWLFYLNLPLSGLAILLVLFFLTLRTPTSSLREKLARMDWVGNFIVILSTALCVIALSWAGTKYPWTSYKILIPLVFGLVGLGIFIVYERYGSKEPVVPFTVLNNRSSLSGYAATFFHGITSISMIYYLPVYFQAAKEATPIQSGVDIFGATFTIAPFAIINGISVLLLNRYRPQNYIAWILGLIGMGLFSTIKADTSHARNIGYQIIEGAGLGILFTSTTFPILAPVKVSEAANALAFFTFLRSFAQTWGISIGSTILQNQLKKRLSSDFISLFPDGQDIAFAIIPQISKLPEPLRSQVRVAFAESLGVIWKTMIGISAAGLLTVLAMQELPMHTTTDENFGFEEKRRVSDVEHSSS